jgi:hypothetical protein
VATPGVGQSLIERYAKTRSERLFRGDGESLILHDSALGHFPVYMSARGSSPDLVTLRARWSARCAHTERIRLHECVNRFNVRNALLTASVHDSHDFSALAVVGNSRFWVRDEDDFRPFARFVDMSLASATKLFEDVYAEITRAVCASRKRSSLSSPAELERYFQLSG